MKLHIKKIINKLINKKLTISVAESCTGGLLSSTLTSFTGASQFYTLGLITYSNSSKVNLLKISNKYLIKHGAVSKQTCLAMVKNLNNIAKTHISVSTTGVAGPSGGTILKPVGLIYIGIKTRKKTVCKKFLIKNKGRNYIQRESVKKALRLISKLVN